MTPQTPPSPTSSPSPPASPFSDFLFGRLGQEAQTAFRVLLRHLQLADSFVLELVELPGEAFVLSFLEHLQSYTAVTTLHQDQSSDTSTNIQTLLAPNSPSLPEVPRCVVVWGTTPDAWPPLLQLLNERRNHLIRVHPCPLLLVGGFFLNEYVCNIAPDLWSLRSGLHRFPDPPPQDTYALAAQEAARPFPVHEPLDIQTLLYLLEAPKDTHTENLQKEQERQASLLLRLGQAYSLQKQHKHALEAAQRGLSMLQASGSDQEQARAWLTLGTLHQRNGDLNTALSCYQQSYQHLPASPSVVAAVALFQMARILEAQGHLEQAIATHHLSFQIKQQRGDHKGMAISLRELGALAAKQGHYDEALALYQQSFAIKTQLHDLFGQAIYHFDVGRIAEKRGEYRKALALYQQSFDIKAQLDDQLGMAICLFHIGWVHEEQQEYNKALALYLDAFDGRELLHDTWGMAQALLQMASVYEKQGNKDKALSFAHRAEQLLQSELSRRIPH